MYPRNAVMGFLLCHENEHIWSKLVADSRLVHRSLLGSQESCRFFFLNSKATFSCVFLAGTLAIHRSFVGSTERCWQAKGFQQRFAGHQRWSSLPSLTFYLLSLKFLWAEAVKRQWLSRTDLLGIKSNLLFRHLRFFVSLCLKFFRAKDVARKLLSCTAWLGINPQPFFSHCQSKANAVWLREWVSPWYECFYFRLQSQYLFAEIRVPIRSEPIEANNESFLLFILRYLHVSPWKFILLILADTCS